MPAAIMGKPWTLEVWGDFACFTRPELKVERYSYPVITPSAVRAIFDAIYWKRGFRWQPFKVELLTVPRYIALRRNEVKEKGPSEREIAAWADGRAEPVPIVADADSEFFDTKDGTKGRTQRQTMALKDVRYRLHARIVPFAGAAAHPLIALDEQFERRARRGQCVCQPVFGCREFPAFFRLVEEAEKNGAPPVPVDLDPGWMVYDTFDLSRPGDPHDAARVSMFEARIRQGVVAIPPYDSPDVHKPDVHKPAAG